MIMEKKSGAMERTKVAGITDLEIMISHFLTQFVLVICQSTISYAIMISVFQIRVQGSIFLAHQLGVLIGVSGICFGKLTKNMRGSRDRSLFILINYKTLM